LPELHDKIQMISCKNNRFIKRKKCKYLNKIIYFI